VPRKSPYIISLSQQERQLLESRARKYTLPYYIVLRARMILLAAEGSSNDEIATSLSVGRDVVSLWRKRFFHQRLPGLEERPVVLQGGQEEKAGRDLEDDLGRLEGCQDHQGNGEGGPGYHQGQQDQSDAAQPEGSTRHGRTSFGRRSACTRARSAARRSPWPIPWPRPGRTRGNETPPCTSTRPAVRCPGLVPPG